MHTLFLFWLVFSLSHSQTASSVPDKMIFCDIEVTITEGAKQKLRTYKKKLYENPKYFNEAVDRADTYLPFVEEALKDGGLPDDLKYLTIQESNLFADAKSSANAIGFWQFKEDAAKENGLKISTFIDERKHIFRSSQAAVKYLRRSNKDFDHWLYAIICYYEGQTGAIKYTDPAIYGTKTLTIDENTHWYLLKTIAYKLAYEDALKITLQPQTWLQPVSVVGPITAEDLAKQNNLSLEQFNKWNKWILNNEIPEGEMCTYYLPRTDLYIGHTPDPTKLMLIAAKNAPKAAPAPTPPPVQVAPPKPNPSPAIVAKSPNETSTTIPQPAVKNTPAQPAVSMMPVDLTSKEALPLNALTEDQYALINIEDDLYYGLAAKEYGFPSEYIIYEGTTLLADLALLYNKRYSDILQWNGLIANEEPQKGTVIYLQKSNKVSFHVVKAGETMNKIASKHHTSAKKLYQKNNISPKDGHIYIGQRLYLKDVRPKNEKLIVLRNKYWQNQMGTPRVNEVPQPQTPPATTQSTSISPNTPQPSPSVAAVATPPVTMPTQPKTTVVETPKETPKPAVTSSTAVEEKPETPQTSRWLEHKVVAGETLWKISVKYQTKVEIIKKVNNLTSDVLSPGQVLKIFTTQPE